MKLRIKAGKTNLVAVIGGPPASGKTTAIKDIQDKFKNLLVIDLDDIIGSDVLDNFRVEISELQNDDEILALKMKLHQSWQKAINSFLSSHKKQMVVVSTTFVDTDTPELKLPTALKFFLNVGSEELWKRKQKRKDSMPNKQDFLNATTKQKKQYLDAGYKPRTVDQILHELENLLK